MRWIPIMERNKKTFSFAMVLLFSACKVCPLKLFIDLFFPVNLKSTKKYSGGWSPTDQCFFDYLRIPFPFLDESWTRLNIPRMTPIFDCLSQTRPVLVVIHRTNPNNKYLTFFSGGNHCITFFLWLEALIPTFTYLFNSF